MRAAKLSLDMKSGTVVLSTARTPFGRLGGALASLAATTLGGEAIRNALLRAGVDPADVEHVIMGQVIQAGAGQAPARQAAFKAGLAKTTTAETVNKVCASGMLAVVSAARSIAEGDHRLAVAGGMESMSNAPYLLPGARGGYRYGNGVLVDAMINDGLWDVYFDEAMAAQGARVAAELGVTRAVQDEFAYESHRRAHAAHEAGYLAAEIVPLNVATKAKGKIVVDAIPQTCAAAHPGVCRRATAARYGITSRRRRWSPIRRATRRTSPARRRTPASSATSRSAATPRSRRWRS